MIRINPTKMLVGGDQKAARNFLGPARSQLEILKNQMSFQNLSQGVRKIWLTSDVYVECRKIFNYQECKIWVRPVDEISGLPDCYYFVRISHPGWFPAYQVPSPSRWLPNLASIYYQHADQGRFLVPDLKMDRLILWEPKQENSTTIVPGEGEIILDVDFVNDVIYHADDRFGTENVLERLKEKFLTKPHYDGVQLSETNKEHPNWETWPLIGNTVIINEKEYTTTAMKVDFEQEDFVDTSEDWEDEESCEDVEGVEPEGCCADRNECENWFHIGRLFSPKDSWFHCNDGYMQTAGHGATVPIDGYYEGEHGNYTHMIDPLLPDYNGNIHFRTQWRAKYCSGYGGDPSFLYSKREWSKLSENAGFYLPTIIMPDGTQDEDTITHIGSWPAYHCFHFQHDDCDGFLHRNGGWGESRGIAKGIFVTGWNKRINFPSFFCYIAHPGLKGGKSSSLREIEKGLPWGDHDYALGVSYWEASFEDHLGFGNASKLVTPLEVIPMAEICSTSGMLWDGGECVPCFSQHDNVSLQTGSYGYHCNIGVLTPDGVAPWEVHPPPCDIGCTDGYPIPGDGAKTIYLIDNHVRRSIKIPDPELINVNLFSFSVLLDRSAAVIAAMKGQWGDDTPEGYSKHQEHFYCGSTFYGESSNIPQVCSNEFGMIFYLMNPQDFWWTDVDTGEIEFWDIHSIRESNPDEINSYRLLDLEDYINNIYLELRNIIRAYPSDDLESVPNSYGVTQTITGGLPRRVETDDGYYGVPAYGYTIYDGFVYK